MHVTLTLHTQQLVSICHVFFIEQVRIAKSFSLMIDIDEVGSHLRYLGHVGQQLKHCAVTPNLHIDGLGLLATFKGMNTNGNCDNPFEVCWFDNNIFQSA